MYGIRHHTSVQGLIPIEHEPWLRAKSIALMAKRVLLGTAGLILLTLLLFPFGEIGLVPDAIGAIMLLVSGLAVIVSLFCLLFLWLEWSYRDTYQYCPDCLSYMTRGANVCPFCGFRPETAPPASPQQTSHRAQTRHF
jgi:hypothetical protein